MTTVIEDIDKREAPTRHPLAGLPARFDSIAKAHARELGMAWADIVDMMERLLTSPAPSIPEEPELESLGQVRRELRDRFLNLSLGRVEAGQPHRRALLALETFEAKLRDLTDTFPEVVTGSWREFAKWLDLPAHRSTRAREIRLRAVVGQVLDRESASWRVAQDLVVKSFSDSLWLMQSLWRNVSVSGDDQALGEARASSADAWKEIVRSQGAATELLEREFARVVGSLRQKVWKRLSPRQRTVRTDSFRHRAYWEAQIRSREGELRLLRASEHAWDSVHAALEELTRVALEEQQVLMDEIASLASWLDKALAQAENPDSPHEPEGSEAVAAHPGAPPPSKSKITPARRRVEELDEVLTTTAQRLPSSIAWLKTREARPPRRERWRMVFPEESFRAAWKDLRPDVLVVLENWERAVREVVLGAERAREVIRFALELTHQGDSEVGSDALLNARELVTFQMGRDVARECSPDRPLGALLSGLFADYLLRIGSSKSDAMAFRLRRGLRRGGTAAERNARELAAGTLRSGLESARYLAGQVLVGIGFQQKEEVHSAVYRRTYLPSQFLNKTERELPAIYQRLFRIEPIEDSRFLIGRHRELGALTEALDSWRQGRRVAALVSGQRGSGKTSLLNCLQADVGEAEIVRSEFSDRITEPRQLEEFLCHLLNLPEASDLVRELNSRKRIVILEELERTFLKQIGSYEAVRAFQELISETCGQTLWILAINQISLRLLNRAVSLEDVFTHRIETAAVSRADLETAIMTRHNLSGLRLRFASRHEALSSATLLKRRLLGVKHPKDEFFDALLTQSRGVYRSAQEIWLAHIDCVEAGQVYMEPIDMPDIAQIVDDLDQDDLFTLLTVMQHGSFSWEEHTKVFHCAPGTSRMRITELVGRELLEADPNHPGYRVRPEAMSVVKEALFRKNLL